MLIADMHNDYLTMSPAPAAYQDTFDAETVVTAAIWTTQLCQSFDDIERFARAAKSGVLLSIEDCGCIAPADTELLCSMRPVYVGIVWNDENRYGGGAYCNAGLTKEGRTLCRALSADGILIDTAHMNDETFYAVYDLELPIIDSHTSIRECHRHPRAISFDRAGKILQRGGRVGLTLVADFFGGGTDAWAAQVDAFCARFGADGLCIGTDFWGSDRYVSPNFDNDYENLSELVEKLSKIGYNEITLQKIFATNYLSLWSETPCINFTTTPSTPDTHPPR